MNFKDEIKSLVKAQTPVVWIQTFEEERIIKELIILFKENFPSYQVDLWDNVSGISRYYIKNDNKLAIVSGAGDPQVKDIKIFGHITKKAIDIDNTEGAAFIFRDFDDILDHYQIKRALRTYAEYKYYNKYVPIFIISPFVKIPQSCQKLITVVNYSLLDKEGIREKVVSIREFIKGYNSKNSSTFEQLEKEDIDKVVESLVGLTSLQVSNFLLRSLTAHSKIDINFLNELRRDTIKTSNVLTILEPSKKLEEIGGHPVLKSWIEELTILNEKEAKEFGCVKPKGMLCLGAPGTGKTIFAEVVATELNIPFLKLDMSKIMDRAVGESEKRIATALETVKAIAPCVLLIDEVEKSLAGVGSSNSSDGGTLARVFGTVLQFLNDNEDVFVVATSNDISQLPPELYRSGRFDTIWYFAMPTNEERKDIFRIYLDKTGKKYNNDIVNQISSETKNFTGAEIKQIVNIAMKKAYIRYRKDNNPDITFLDLKNSISEVNPIYNFARANIIALEDFASRSARFTSVKDSVEVKDDGVLKLHL